MKTKNDNNNGTVKNDPIKNHSTANSTVQPSNGSTHRETAQFSPLPPVRKSNRSPNGKVARLPAIARQIVNDMLYNGFPYKEIISTLEAIGYPGFSHKNISRWKCGFHQHWLRQHNRPASFPLPLGGEGKGEGAVGGEGKGEGVARGNGLTEPHALLGLALDVLLLDLALRPDRPGETALNLQPAKQPEASSPLPLGGEGQGEGAVREDGRAEVSISPDASVVDQHRIAALNAVDEILGIRLPTARGKSQ